MRIQYWFVRTCARALSAVAVMGWVAGVSAGAGAESADATATAIVVNFGDHKSAEAAANAQNRVDWYDDHLEDDTICTEAFAAVELRRYLNKMAGRDADDSNALPIIDDDQALRELGDNRMRGVWFVVGSPGNNLLARDTKSATMDDMPGKGVSGGFEIKTRGIAGAQKRFVVLRGNDRAGTLYAVYDYLERLGCRWYAPGEVHEVVPRTDLKSLPDVNVIDWPRFRTRGFWAWEDRGNPDFFDWMARNRMNYWTSAQSDIPNLKKRCMRLTCGGHQHTVRFLNPAAPYPYNHGKIEGDESRPKDPYAVGEAFRGDTSGDGILTYGEAHPEWYGLRGGRRVTDLRANVNFCTSNEDAVAEMMKNLVDDLIGGEWRMADTVNFWTLDGGKWCECARCKALGTPTDRNLLLVHALRQTMKRAMAEGRLERNVSIEFLAYADVIEPPTRPLPAGFDYENCSATFFPIVRCYVHRFTDPSCTEFNTRYQKHYYGWAVDPDRHYRGQLFIGEYYNVSGYKNLPVLYYRTMPQDIRHFYKTGARHMHYMHAPTGNWGTRALTNYELARLLWNPDLDEAALLDDYFKGRYGPAADRMRRFYASLERALCNVSVLKYHVGRRLGRGQEPFNLQHMRLEDTTTEQNDGPDFESCVAAVLHCQTIMDEIRAVDLPPKCRKRIREDEGLFRYAMNTILFYNALIRSRMALDEGDRGEAARMFKQAEELAGKLRNETEATKWASSHANAVNGLQASFAAPALERLRRALKSD